MVSFITRQQHIAALYDACHLIVDTYFQTDLLDIYEDHKLSDSHRLQATCREIMNLIAEGSIK